jgi:hypothetical protein
MAPRGYRDVTVENGRVREVHVIDHNHYVEVYDIAEWKALILAARNPPVRQARREYMCLHCRMKKQFIRLNSHRRQGCPWNKNAAGVPIREKMYPNLLTASTARDLEGGADPAELIWLYNAGWYRHVGGDAMVDEAARQVGDASGAPEPVLAPAPAAMPAAPRPRAPRETQQSSQPPRQTVETERKDSRQRGLQLPQPPNDVSEPDIG